MRRTSAVRRTEAGKRHRASSQTGKSVGPRAFLPDGAVCVPDGNTLGFPAQIVDVPVQTFDGPQMMADPCLQPTRPQGAAYVNVEARLHRKPTQPPDLNSLPTGGAEDEGIRSGAGLHGVRRIQGKKEANYVQDDPEGKFFSSCLRKQVSMPWIPASAGMTTGGNLQVCNSQ